MDNRIYEGPSMPLSQEIDAMKYRQQDESFDGKVKRIANALADDNSHKLEMEEILGEMRFLPAGRVQSAIGWEHELLQHTTVLCLVISKTT